MKGRIIQASCQIIPQTGCSQNLCLGESITGFFGLQVDHNMVLTFVITFSLALRLQSYEKELKQPNFFSKKCIFC